MESVRNLQSAGASGDIGVVETRFEHFDEPLELRCGDTLSGFTLAWEQYGELNAARDNVVLLFHALTGSHHAAGTNHGVPGLGEAWTDEMVVGWWHEFIGPGRPIDTDHFCVICVNYIGGCYGSTGPLSIDPATGERWGPSFPRVRFSDSVRAAMRLVDRLGIDVLHAGIGPSTGGMAVLDLAVMFPERGSQRRRDRGRHGSDASPADPQLRADPGGHQPTPASTAANTRRVRNSRG